MASRTTQANGTCASPTVPPATFWGPWRATGEKSSIQHAYKDAYKNGEVPRAVIPTSRVFWKPRPSLISITETKLDASVFEVTSLGTEGDPDCPICKDKLSDQSGLYDDTCDESTMVHGVARHEACGRMMHSACLAGWVGSFVERDGMRGSGDKMSCPMCRDSSDEWIIDLSVGRCI